MPEVHPMPVITATTPPAHGLTLAQLQDEMSTFKQEMSTFKQEMKQEIKDLNAKVGSLLKTEEVRFSSTHILYWVVFAHRLWLCPVHRGCY